MKLLGSWKCVLVTTVAALVTFTIYSAANHKPGDPMMITSQDGESVFNASQGQSIINSLCDLYQADKVSGDYCNRLCFYKSHQILDLKSDNKVVMTLELGGQKAVLKSAQARFGDFEQLPGTPSAAEFEARVLEVANYYLGLDWPKERVSHLIQLVWPAWHRTHSLRPVDRRTLWTLVNQEEYLIFSVLPIARVFPKVPSHSLPPPRRPPHPLSGPWSTRRSTSSSPSSPSPASFPRSLPTHSLRPVDRRTLWTLVNQEEYLIFSVLPIARVFPKVPSHSLPPPRRPPHPLDPGQPGGVPHLLRPPHRPRLSQGPFPLTPSAPSTAAPSGPWSTRRSTSSSPSSPSPASFPRSLPTHSLRPVDRRTLWTLVNQEEYLIFSVLPIARVFPKVPSHSLPPPRRPPHPLDPGQPGGVPHLLRPPHRPRLSQGPFPLTPSAPSTAAPSGPWSTRRSTSSSPSSPSPASFPRSLPTHSLRPVDRRTLWTLVNQEEYLIFSVLSIARVFPKVIGSCGHFYVVEHLVPFKLKSYYTSLRAKILVHLMGTLKLFYEFLNEPLHWCDVKFENFGLSAEYPKRFMVMDGDMVYTETRMNRLLAKLPCRSDSDCHFFDCKAACNTTTDHCGPRLNDNIDVFCSKLVEELFGSFWSSSNRYLAACHDQKLTSPQRLKELRLVWAWSLSDV